MTLLEIARAYLAAGFSTFPIAADGRKAPGGPLPIGEDGRPTWTPFQARRATAEELESWYGDREQGIAIVGGPVSGNLEILDIEGPDKPRTRDDSEVIGPESRVVAWVAAVKAQAPGLLDRLPLVRTPSRGLHVYYRCPGDPGGNKKLAALPGPDPAKPGIKSDNLIETRGRGGYVVAPGSPAACSKNGRLYDYAQRIGAVVRIEDTPTLTDDEVDLLRQCARDLDAMPLPVPVESPRPRGATAPSGELMPGQDFNVRADWMADVMGPAGWVFVRQQGDVKYLRRPGKRDGISASLNYRGGDVLCVFSSNGAPFEMFQPGAGPTYTKFGAYAVLNHGGDFAAAARTLRRAGYGGRNEEPSGKDRGTSEEPAPEGVNLETGEVLGEDLAATKKPKKARKPKTRQDQTQAAADRFMCTDYGNAERLVAKYGRELRHCAGHAQWYAWNGTWWERDGTGEIVRRAKATVRAIYRTAADLGDDAKRAVLAKHAAASEASSQIHAMIKLAESEVQVAIKLESMDADPWLLGCDNGTVDLRTGELRPAKQEDLITKSTRLAFDPGAGCPRWEEFLDRFTVGRNDLIEFLWRAVGYSLTASTREQCLFLLQGPPATGKSTFTDVVRRILGDYGRSTPAETFMADARKTTEACELARFDGARLILAAESEEGQRLKEAFVKSATGGERIRARHLYGSPFDFEPKFKVWISTNHRPDIRETDGGIWRRMRLIPCTGTLAEEEQQRGYSAALLAAEAPGILAWAVRGASAWQRDGLPVPPAVVEATASYRAEQDVLASFFAECCEIGGGNEEEVMEVYIAYSRWAHANGMRPRGSKTFSISVVARGFDRGKSTRTDRITFCGLRLKEEEKTANLNGKGYEKHWND